MSKSKGRKPVDSRDFKEALEKEVSTSKGKKNESRNK